MSERGDRLTRGQVLVLVAMCGLTMVSLGLVLKLPGLFFAPVAEAFGCGRGEVSFSLTVVNVCSALAGLAVARIMRKVSLKPIVAAGAACAAGGTAGLGLAQGLVSLYLLSAAQGIGAGLIGSVLVTNVVGSWFVERRAFAVSLAFGASGIAGAIFSPVISNVIQTAGWRAGYVASGTLMLVFCLPALLLPVSAAPTGEAPRATKGKAAPTAPASNRARFVAVLYFAFVATMVTAVPHHFPGMAEADGLAVAAGALMISTCMVMNTCGKFLVGWAIGRLGLRRASVADVALVVAGVLLLVAVRTEPGVYVAAALVGCTYSVVTVVLSSVVRAMFGDAAYASVFPKANLASTLGTAVGAPFIGFVFDATQGYAPALLILTALLGPCLAVVSRLPQSE